MARRTLSDFSFSAHNYPFFLSACGSSERFRGHGEQIGFRARKIGSKNAFDAVSKCNAAHSSLVSNRRCGWPEFREFLMLFV
jgi:hypothetical protein